MTPPRSQSAAGEAAHLDMTREEMLRRATTHIPLTPEVADYLISAPNVEHDLTRLRRAVFGEMLEHAQALLGGSYLTQLSALRLSSEQLQGDALELAGTLAGTNQDDADNAGNNAHWGWNAMQDAALSLVVAKHLGGRVRAGCPVCGELQVEDERGINSAKGAKFKSGDPAASARTLELGELTRHQTDRAPLGLSPAPPVESTPKLWAKARDLWTWMECSCGHQGWLPGFVSVQGAEGRLIEPAED